MFVDSNYYVLHPKKNFKEKNLIQVISSSEGKTNQCDETTEAELTHSCNINELYANIDIQTEIVIKYDRTRVNIEIHRRNQYC